MSPETRAWVQEHAPPDTSPAWMPVETFVALQRLLRELEEST